MLRGAIFAVGVCAVVAAWRSTAPAAQGRQAAIPVRVLTYNIHHGEGSDGVLDLPRTAAVINSVSPDLVALQEVDEKTERSGGVSQVTELGRLTGLRPVFGEAMPYQGGGYGVAILSRWPLLAIRNRPLPRVDANREPRTALSVTVRPAADHPDVTLTTTHFDFGRGDGRDLQARAIDEMLAGDDTLSIIAGDLNSGEESEVVRILRERWSEIDVPGPTAMSGAGRLIYRLDWLFVRPASRWRLLEARRVEEMTASDHLPVFAVLEATSYGR